MKKVLIVLAATFTFVGCGGSKSEADILESMWDGFGSGYQEQLCESYIRMGSETAFEVYNQGAGDATPYPDFKTFFDGKCL